MNAAEYIVERLLDQAPVRHDAVFEVSLHLPRRGKLWVAHFTGPEPGQQIWRSTKLSHYAQALALAKKWEQQARAQRMAHGAVSRKPALRVRRSEPEPTGGLLTQREVALLLGMSERGVRAAEKRALKKLRSHPLLRQIWRQYLACELGETVDELTSEETAALLGLARCPSELCLIHKVIRLITPCLPNR